ncbi:MAG: discoidin domain-containing protein [Abditibacteriota bacterium]|nr:discoidin domain-containing protein [Abditibacteriota bacterium]
MKLFACISALLLLSAAAFAEFREFPSYFCGINQVAAEKASPERPFNLTDEEILAFREKGVNTIRIPLYAEAIGIPEKLYYEDGRTFDREKAESWPLDWSRLDGFLEQCIKYDITPYVCPHPFHFYTVYIPEDRESAEWFTLKVVEHISEKYGSRVIYGWYENIWRNSHDPWWKGEYRHTKYPLFLKEFRSRLREKYGTVEKLNKAWKSNYADFSEAEIPDMGSVERGVPESAMDSRRTYDLRYIIDMMSLDAVREIKAKVKALAPDCIWVGSCFHDSFGGLGQVKGGNPPNCNWSLRTHALTSDALAADSYQHRDRFMASYRTVEKLAYLYGIPWFAVEINAQSRAAMKWIPELGGNNTGSLVWDGRDNSAFALMREDGSFTPLIDDAERLWKRAPEKRRPYRVGRIYVYYPEESYEYMVSWENYLDCYCKAFLCVASPDDIEPVTTAELQALEPDREIYVFENHLPRKAIDELNRRKAKCICPHEFFIDEDGKRVERAYKPDDFDESLKYTKYGLQLLPAFRAVEIKAFNAACPEKGAVVSCPSELKKNGDGMASDVPANLIDGDQIASRILFADTDQREELEVALGSEKTVRGAFFVTEAEDKGRIPSGFSVWVSSDGKNYKEVYDSKPEIKENLNIVYFPPVKAAFVKLDFGVCGDKTGTRLMEIGVLESAGKGKNNGNNK